jgi:hypothetical protein
MKRILSASAILMLLAMPAAAQDGSSLASQYNPSQVTQVSTPWGAVVGAQQPMISRQKKTGMPWRTGAASGSSCGSNGCGTEHTHGERLEKLIDFLLYRPTIPCDRCLRPSEYMPPLTAYFPNRCNATMGDGTGCQGGCRHHAVANPRTGCASCAASLGAPMTANRMESRTVPAAYQMNQPQPTESVMRQSRQAPLRLHTTVARPTGSYDAAAATLPNMLPSSLQSAPTPYNAARMFPQAP